MTVTVWTISQDSAAQNIWQLDTHLTELAAQQGTERKDLMSFFTSLSMNFLTDVIINLAELDDKDKPVWEAAKAHIQEESFANCTVCFD